MVMMGLYIKGDQKSRETAMTFHTKLMSAIQAQKVRNLSADSNSKPAEISS